MNPKYEKILSYYEDIKLHTGTLSGKEGFFDFQPPSSLHSEVTAFAYGIREKKSAVSLGNYPCTSVVMLSETDLTRRFYIKLQAQLFKWEKYICGIKISVNGKDFYKNDREFFENVNLGWPTVYIPVDEGLLKAGENTVEITQTSGETHLLVADVSLLSLPKATPNQQLTVKTAVRMGDIFALSFYVPEGEVAVKEIADCEITDIIKSPINATHTIVGIKVCGENLSLTLDINGETVSTVMPEVFPASDDFCMVGTDSDDHRHDDSDETDRIIEIFANTNLGNFWQARPQEFRNYHDLSSKEIWKNRVDYLKAFNTQMSLTDGENDMPYFPDLCGEKFVGKHFHESYLYFCSALVYDEKLSRELFLDVDALRGSNSFGETRKLFQTVLKKMYESCRAAEGLTSVGSPSLLTIYEASSGFERVTIEPVSNANLLIGAVRGVAPKMWGAHVPTDWYFGEPNDVTKANKFLLAMQLLYMHGADYIYAENSLFKTNAFSREDWEDEFCTICRKYLREFYDYTVKNPREGKLKADLAVLYGNNEYFMWHHDDRMAELPENDDWDITVWGKWKDNRHQKCWRAIDAWLPLADNQHSKKNILNLDLFSGTPYGTVNIIPYESDYTKYKALALLGWNTYEDGFAEKIRDYLEQGGTAFVSYCHFNKTDVSGEPMVYASADALGIKCGEIVTTDSAVLLNNLQTAVLGEEITLVKCETDGEKVAVDENGNVVVWKKKIGKGTLYFGTFADFNCPDGKMEVLKYVLELMGEDAADVICSNSNICFTERVTEDGKSVIDVLNVSSNGKDAEKFELIFKDGSKISGEAAPCEIKTIKR